MPRTPLALHAGFAARAARLRPGAQRTHDGGHDRPTLDLTTRTCG
jgi:hypothetical protein